MNYYRAYGLNIESELELPEFTNSDSGGDVTIRLEEPRMIPPEYFPDPVYFRIEPDEAILSFKQVGFFRLAKGRQISVIPEPGVDRRLLQILVTGHAMATLLFQRGLLVLHSSVVAIDGQAIALLGAQGAGKSSLAAMLEKRGHLLLSDDVGAVDRAGNHPIVYPGYSRLKLSPEVAQALGYDKSTLYKLNPEEDKLGRKFGRPLPDHSFPLKRVYLLTESETTGIEMISAQQAVLEIVRHSYPTRLAQPGGAAHFSACVALVRELGLYALKKRRSLDELKRLAEIVEQHAIGRD